MVHARRQRAPARDDLGRLLVLARAGDRDAFVRLLVEARPILERAVADGVPARWRCLISSDDLVQETCADICRAFARFEGTEAGAFVRWLRVLARHNLVDAARMLRAEKRGGTAEVDNRLAAIDDRAVGDRRRNTARLPHEDLVARERSRVVRAALRRLPANQRLVIELYDLGGLAPREVARWLNRSVGAVHMLRARAHRSLSRLLCESAE